MYGGPVKLAAFLRAGEFGLDESESQSLRMKPEDFPRRVEERHGLMSNEDSPMDLASMRNGLHEHAILPFREIQEKVFGFLKEANPPPVGLSEFADGQCQIQGFIRGPAGEGCLISSGNVQRTETSQAKNAGHLSIGENQPLLTIIKNER